MFLPLLPGRLREGLRGAILTWEAGKKTSILSPSRKGGKLSAVSNPIFVNFMYTQQHTHTMTLLSDIYWCLIWRMIVFRVFGSFNCVKVLEMYWLLTVCKNKIFELYYRGWHCSWMGQSVLQSFLTTYMILVQEPEIFLFMFHDSSHLLSQHELGAQWHPAAEHNQMMTALLCLRAVGMFN